MNRNDGNAELLPSRFSRYTLCSPRSYSLLTPFPPVHVFLVPSPLCRASSARLGPPRLSLAPRIARLIAVIIYPLPTAAGYIKFPFTRLRSARARRGSSIRNLCLSPVRG